MADLQFWNATASKDYSMPSIPPDVVAFIEGYPAHVQQGDDLDFNDNLNFYSNKLRCRPDGLLVDELHER